MLYENMTVRNSVSRYVYYNRIDNLMNASIYPFLSFIPSEYLFRLQIYESKPYLYGKFDDMAERRIVADPMIKKITSVYFMNVGEHYFNVDRYNPAVPVLDACAYFDPENIPCRFFLGLIYKKWGEYDPSLANMKEALKLLLDQPARQEYGPTDYLMLSRIYSELGQFDKAQKYEEMVQPDAANIPVPGTSRPE